MVKTPFIVAGVLIVAIAAAVAYVELRPAPVAVAPKPLAPAATLVPAQPAAPATPPAPQPPADCLLPGPPPVAPDGGAATADDMKLAHDVIQSFVMHLEAYQACRESQVAKADSTVTEQQKQTWRDQGNAAVDEAQALAAAFAAQLKIYHKKHPEPLAPAPAK
jgi:2-oxoglutarate dehydrogenase E2 component (dihydrolipoamide succinyltransferase)